MASSAFHGSATPSPFASTPQRSQVDGMNCIQPIAPAELGPMLRPKSDSTLLIAASTVHGMPYCCPAACQIGSNSSNDSCCGAAGGVESASGKTVVPSAFGVSAVAAGAVKGEDTTNVSAEAAPQKRSAAAAAASRRIIRSAVR